MEKNIIYIMNHYSNNSVQHFYHILNLLSAIADNGVKIALIIEKCEDIPIITHPNIMVICQKERISYKRAAELLKILIRLIKSGYSKIFVRISINAAIISIIASKLYRVQTYYWQSGTTFEVDKDKKLFNKVKWFISSYSRLWVVKTYIDNFVTGPETMIEYYINVLKVKPSKMLLLYNDIDIKRFSVASSIEKITLRHELGLSCDEKIILMVHRLSPVRKTDKYIPEVFEDVLFENYNARLLIIGDGPEKALLKQKVMNSKMNERIELIGAMPNSLINKYYRASDIFINPSYTEGFPRVVIEAMACGLPVIATNAGGTMDIFESKQKKFIVEKEDINLFKEKLKEVLINDALRIELGNENLSRVQRFSTEAISEMYIERIFNNG